MLKTIFLLVPVAGAVSAASQLTTVGTSTISQKHTVKFDIKRAQTDTNTSSRKTFALHCIRFV
jgi:hypothetical protein